MELVPLPPPQQDPILAVTSATTLFPNTEALRVWASTHDFLEDTIQP